MRCSTGAGRFTAFVMSTLVASPKAFRPVALRSTSSSRDRLHLLTRHQHHRVLPACYRCYRRSSTSSSVTPQRSASMLGVDAGFGLAGISALGALRLLTSTAVAPKRVRVVTDIDDTVKSSGNKRLFGIPLGGIDAQCEKRGRGDWRSRKHRHRSLRNASGESNTAQLPRRYLSCAAV